MKKLLIYLSMVAMLFTASTAMAATTEEDVLLLLNELKVMQGD